MGTIIFFVCYFVVNMAIYYSLVRRYNYDPGVDFAFGMQTGDYKLAAVKFLEIFIANALILTGVRYSLLAVLEFLIYVDSLIG